MVRYAGCAGAHAGMQITWERESLPWPDSSPDDPEVEDACSLAWKQKRYHLKEIYALDVTLVLPAVLVLGNC